MGILGSWGLDSRKREREIGTGTETGTERRSVSHHVARNHTHPATPPLDRGSRQFFKLNKTITPPWIEVISLPKIIESTENEYQNTTEVQFTVIMTERPQTDSGVVYIIYDWYLW